MPSPVELTIHLQLCLQLLHQVNLAEHWNEPELAKRKTKEEWKELVYKRIEQDQEDKRMLEMGEMVSQQRYMKIKEWGRMGPERAQFQGEIGPRV